MTAATVNVPRTRLPRAAVDCPRIGFGGSRLHYLWSDAERQALLSAAVDRGCGYFDVAPSYGFGLAERAVGRFLTGSATSRTAIVVATKWGIPGAGWLDAMPTPALRYGVMAEALRRKGLGAPDRPVFTSHELQRSLEASLRRLRTDYIDVLWMHEPEPARIPDPDALLAGLDAMRAAGKIRAYGIAGYARHVVPTLAHLAQAGDFDPSRMAIQCDEGEWPDGDPPDVTFGVLSRGPQSAGAAKPDPDEAATRLQQALDRRAAGSVLISTTRPTNLRFLVNRMEWR